MSTTVGWSGKQDTASALKELSRRRQAWLRKYKADFMLGRRAGSRGQPEAHGSPGRLIIQVNLHTNIL